MATMRRLLPCILLFLGFVGYAGDLWAVPIPADPQIRTALGGIETAGPPRIVNEYLLLTYRSDLPPRFLGAAFSHENFATVHSFVRNEEGIYLLVFPIPETSTELQYRLVIDGLWTLDPQNPNTRQDPFGHLVSVVSIPRSSKKVRESPILRTGRYVQFRYFGPSHTRISVAGDFNAWDPFSHPLLETTPGVFETTIRIRPGRHFYHFVIDGTILPDPLNPERADSHTRGTVSILDVP
jgi:hypothetical protein